MPHFQIKSRWAGDVQFECFAARHDAKRKK